MHVLAGVRARVEPHRRGPPEAPRDGRRRHCAPLYILLDTEIHILTCLIVMHVHIKRHIEQHVKIGNFDVFHVEFIISTFIFYKIIPVTGCFLLIWSILLESRRSGGIKCFFKFEFGVIEDKHIGVSKYCFYCNISG